MSQSFENLSEAEVVKLAQEGDAAAEEYIINKYKNLVRSQARAYYLMGAEAEDLLQEGMIGLFKAVRDYDENRCSTFFAFAQLCIRRQLISALKGATRQKHIPLNSYVSLNKPIYDDESDRTLLDVLTGQGVTDPERLMISKEDYRLIGDKIENLLSPFEKRVLDLYLDGLSYADISEKLTTHSKSIDNALQRVKRKLERALKSIL